MTVLAAAFSLTPLSASAVRIPIVAVFVFIVPGLSITNNLFHGLPQPFYERIAYSIGLSVALLALGGLVLHGLGLGFQTQVWMLLLCGVTIVNLAINAARPARGNIEETYRLADFSLLEFLFYTLACVIVVTAILFSIAGDQYPTTRFTELWVTQENESASVLNIGVSNHEMQTVSYQIEVLVNRRPVYRQNIDNLNSNLTWEAHITLPEPPPMGDIVQVQLYRQDQPDAIYRTVHVRRS